MKDIVIFRKWNNGEVIALFPFIPDSRYFCTSYMHVGQHSGADYYGVIRGTKPALYHDYKSLYDELTRIGYDMEVKQRKPIKY
jgi:hypothetical protein